MLLKKLALAPRLTLSDVFGHRVTIGGASGRRTLLCFLRDAACPFCNLQIYLLTHRYEYLASQGLDVIVIFHSTAEEVRRFVARKPRPFPVVADPDSTAYDAYHIEHSLWAKLKAIATRVPSLIKGLRIVGLAGLNTNNIVPADFLLEADGTIAEAYYGRDAGDHIPFHRIEAFAGNPPTKTVAGQVTMA